MPSEPAARRALAAALAVWLLAVLYAALAAHPPMARFAELGARLEHIPALRAEARAAAARVARLGAELEHAQQQVAAAGRRAADPHRLVTALADQAGLALREIGGIDALAATDGLARARVALKLAGDWRAYLAFRRALSRQDVLLSVDDERIARHDGPQGSALGIALVLVFYHAPASI